MSDNACANQEQRPVLSHQLNPAFLEDVYLKGTVIHLYRDAHSKYWRLS